MMMLFRSFAIGLLAAILLLSLHHVHEHMHHSAESAAPVVVMAPGVAAVAPAGSALRATPRPGALRPPARPRAGSPAIPRVATIPGDTLIVDIERSTLEELLRAESALHGTRLVAPRSQGRSHGVELSGIRSDGLFAVLGFAGGDVVTNWNGRHIKPSVASSEPLAGELFSGGIGDFVDINFLRAGKLMRMVILLH